MPSRKCRRQRRAALGSFNMNGSVNPSLWMLREAALRRLKAQA